MVDLRLAAAVAAVFILALGQAGSAASAPKTSIVSTKDGKLQGLAKAGTVQYLGVPFAAPPVGDLRWRPPEPVTPWRGVRKATRFGGSCPQNKDLGDYAKASVTEDCLYLNVYVPAKLSKTPRAVMAWIPGGGAIVGASDDYDGAALARRGDVIVVIMNYRLGALGFFAHPAIDGEGHENGNYGMMDQQASLRWIQDNIAKFGGDPKRVTIFGQSAGGSSVLIHMVSPASQGLFQQVIIESGQRMNLPTEADAAKKGVDFAKAAGCPDQSAACLRALPVKTILDNQTPYFVSTVRDGKIIPVQLYSAFQAGQFTHVPAINGLAGDEQGFQLAIAEEQGGKPLTADGYADFIKQTYGAHAAEVGQAYPLANYASPSLAEIAVVQGQKACLTHRQDRWLAAGAPLYTYSFDDHKAPTYFPEVSFAMGAYHTSEIPYLFPGFHGGTGVAKPFTPAQRKLSDAMIDAWAGFAKTGKPEPTALDPWPLYDPKRDNYQSIDVGISQNKDGYGERNNCAFWDKIAAY